MKPLKLDFSKLGGILPAIVQDAFSGKVLMLGFMNEEAWNRTQAEGRVTFYSRTRKKIWQKGEESGNYLEVISSDMDCDGDTLLLLASPAGPVCHRGTVTCFDPVQIPAITFLSELQDLIDSRKKEMPEGSYTASLFRSGNKKIAQKVGEEAVEFMLEALGREDELFMNEAADLLYHMLVLLSSKNKSIREVAALLQKRHTGKK